MAPLLQSRSTGAAEALVLDHRRLARHLARRYVRSADQREDLEQVAYLGLVKAAQRFDPERGVAFTSFAMPTILGELRRFCRDTRWAVRVPRALQERVQALRRAEDEFHSRHGRSPSVAEVAASLDWTPEEVLDARIAANGLHSESLNAPVRSADGEAETAIESFGEEESGYAEAEQRDELAQALACLTHRERRALRLRGEDNCSTPEIARRMGLSTPQATRLVARAVSRLRAVLDGETPIAPVRESETVRLTEADPELFAAAGEAAAARRLTVPSGRWSGPRGGDALGLLVLAGTLLRTVALGCKAHAELIGPGDVIRRAEGEAEASWRVVEPAELAVLDASLCRWPAVVEALLQRASDRAHALTVQLAITDLRRAEDRLVRLFASLAQRWGRRVPEGVEITVPLTHEMLAMLVGTHRPTVTSALRRLERDGRLRRVALDHWLLPEAGGADRLAA